MLSISRQSQPFQRIGLVPLIFAITSISGCKDRSSASDTALKVAMDVSRLELRHVLYQQEVNGSKESARVALKASLLQNFAVTGLEVQPLAADSYHFRGKWPVTIETLKTTITATGKNLQAFAGRIYRFQNKPYTNVSVSFEDQSRLCLLNTKSSEVVDICVLEKIEDTNISGVITFWVRQIIFNLPAVR